MKTKTIYVDHFQDIYIDIHLIGYPEEGESVLCFLREKERILYTFVIDGYIYTDGRQWCSWTDHLLNHWQIEHIDAFIWTHPDVDHSLDIPRILDTYDKTRQAIIYMPELDGIKGLKPVASATNNYLHNKYSKKGSRKYDVKIVDVDIVSDDDENEAMAKGLYRLNLVERSNMTGESLNCEFYYLAPVRDFVDRYLHYEMKPNFNDLSLALALSINGRNILFCGDVENKTIHKIDDNMLHDVVYVKIPHHASNTSSDALFDRLKCNHMQDAISTTTTFKANGLPDRKLLKKYKTFSKGVYTTGSDREHMFGCVTTSFSLCDFTNWTQTEGSAKAV